MKNKTIKNLTMKSKRILSNKIIELKWGGDFRKGSPGFAEYYKPEGVSPILNSRPLQGGSTGLGKRK